MVDVLPFVGTRYHGSISMSAVVAPPYDVVTEAQREVLEHRDPVNAIRLELPQPDPRRELDAYHAASARIERWLRRGVLLPDPEPALYPYRMTTVGGSSSTGIIGAVRIDGDAGSQLLPHEETLPRARSDRLDLLRATRANLSPIWGLAPAPGLTALVAREDRPDAVATDDDGVRHELWRLTDREAITSIRHLLGPVSLVVADGHHRLETARRFLEETGDAPGTSGGSGVGGSASSVMALVTELTPAQLHVGAIHRALAGLGPGTDAVEVFGRWFDLVCAGPSGPGHRGALTDPDMLTLATTAGTYRLVARPHTEEAAGNDLDTGTVAVALADLGPHDLRYCHSRAEAVALLDGGEADAVVLLRPVGVDRIIEWARQHRQMPPKTTYFAPKPRTGMVFRLMDP